MNTIRQHKTLIIVGAALVAIVAIIVAVVVNGSSKDRQALADALGAHEKAVAANADLLEKAHSLSPDCLPNTVNSGVICGKLDDAIAAYEALIVVDVDPQKVDRGDLVTQTQTVVATTKRLGQASVELEERVDDAEDEIAHQRQLWIQDAVDIDLKVAHDAIDRATKVAKQARELGTIDEPLITPVEEGSADLASRVKEIEEVYETMTLAEYDEPVHQIAIDAALLGTAITKVEAAIRTAGHHPVTVPRMLDNPTASSSPASHSSSRKPAASSATQASQSVKKTSSASPAKQASKKASAVKASSSSQSSKAASSGSSRPKYEDYYLLDEGETVTDPSGRTWTVTEAEDQCFAIDTSGKPGVEIECP